MAVMATALANLRRMKATLRDLSEEMAANENCFLLALIYIIFVDILFVHIVSVLPDNVLGT